MRAIILICALAASGCGAIPKLTPQGRDVRFTSNSKATAGCHYVGDVTPSRALDPKILGQSEHAKALWAVDARNKAAQMGADLVYSADPLAWGAGVQLEAYLCKKESP